MTGENKIPNTSKRRRYSIAMGLLVGAGVGNVLGNLALGVGLGVVFGVALGRKKHTTANTKNKIL